MDRRPISESVRRWLLAELDAWRAGGILAADQPGRILDLYETPADAAGRRRSMAVFTLCGVAAVLVGLAVFLLVGYNWQDMSRTLKVGVIFGALVGSYVGAYQLRGRMRWRLTSEIVFFLAAIFYGASIWLVAQVFHIQSHYPDGIWFWALGVLPLALCLDMLLMHALYAGLLALWVGTEILGFHELNPWLFGGGFLPRGAYTLPLLVAPGLVWAYRRQSALAIGIYAPLLAWWAVLQPVAWQWHVEPIYFIGLAGALLLLIAEMHRAGSRLAMPYRFYGVLITGGVLIPLSFGRFIFHLLHDGSAENDYVAGLVIGLIGAVAALIVVLLQHRDAPDGRPNAGSYRAILVRQWLPLALVLLLAGLCFWCGAFSQHEPGQSTYVSYANANYDILKWSPQVLVPMAAINVAMIALALWLMRLGLAGDRTGPFAAGVLYFLLWAVLRYADLFAGVGGMLGAAVMFLMCAVGLLAVARFWLHRKEALPSPFGRGAGGEGGEAAVVEENVSSADTLTLTFSQRERGPEQGVSQRESEPRSLPAWLERIAAWVKGRQRTLLWLGLGLQVAVLAAMILFKAGPLWTGETILLRVVPVDPRDIFRGDYVTLNYEFSRVPSEGIPGLGSASHHRRRDWQGKTVFVSLVPEEDGKHWQALRYSTERPTSGRYIRGTIVGWNSIQYGIESYYVQEGQGREYEDAVRSKKLSAEVALAADGRAVLRRLHIETPLPSAGPTYEAAGNHRWPSDATYRVRRLPRAKIEINGRADEPEWSRANVERHFVFPWKKTPAPSTEFSAFCDDEYLYFAFRAEDSDIVVLDELRDEEDVVSEDRVEIFFSRDNQMDNYYCLEIDSRGRVFDYHGSYYRQFDATWNCQRAEVAAAPLDGGYAVEGRIPLTSFAEMGLSRPGPGDKILCGLYRAEFSHDQSDKPIARTETIHNQGRKLDGPPPVETWISWVDPETPEPDFHVPSSLGRLEIVK